jgi:hypothetical protein
MASDRASSEDRFEGFLERIDNGWVFGWAWNGRLPNAPIEIEVLVDGTSAGRATASLYRPDLESVGKGDGRHGFEAQLPDGVRTHSRTIEVRFAGTDRSLQGSPRVVAFDDAADAATGPAYRSRFGGLWTDLSNAREVLDGKADLGWITAEEKALLTQWIEEGYVLLQGAVPPETIDRLDADVESVWRGTSSKKCYVEFLHEGAVIHPASARFKEERAKLLDLHVHFDSARQVVFHPRVVRFISLVLERPMLAFQSLYFRWGSQQAVHQDTAYVKVSSPLEFVASWVALEDVRPDSGELEYYARSHTLDDFLFDGRHKWMPSKSTQEVAYLEGLHARSAERGLERRKFRPKKGDVFLWSADLAHGGSQKAEPGRTRKSIVTHYCPVDCDPVYGGGEMRPERRRHDSAAWYIAHPRG